MYEELGVTWLTAGVDGVATRSEWLDGLRELAARVAASEPQGEPEQREPEEGGVSWRS